MLHVFFWVPVVLILYSYLGYFLLIRMIAKLGSRTTGTDEDYAPKISVIVSAFNEQAVILDKIRNCKKLDYPQDRLEILFGLDGSTDETESILAAEGNSRIRTFPFRTRRGKASVLNDLVQKAQGEILVFSDANTMYERNALRKLTRHFVNGNVGGVCGELVLQPDDGADVGANGERLFWNYEKKLKSTEGRIKTVLGANGAIYAIRKALYERLPQDKMIMDDFLIPLKVVQKGYRVLYDSEAIGIENAGTSIAEEFRRKVRIGIGNFNALSEIGNLLNPARGFVALALWSHKIIRWFVPFLALVALIANILLLGNPLYNVTFAIQIGFYFCALIGAALNRLGSSKNIFSILYYIFMVNFALMIGFFRFIFRPRSTSWTPTRRTVL